MIWLGRRDDPAHRWLRPKALHEIDWVVIAEDQKEPRATKTCPFKQGPATLELFDATRRSSSAAPQRSRRDRPPRHGSYRSIRAARRRKVLRHAQRSEP